MRRIITRMTGVAVLAGLVLVSAAGQDEPLEDAGHKAQSQPDAGDAGAAFEAFVNAEDWRQAKAAGEELLTFGERALPHLEHAAEHHEDADVRRRCYELMMKTFPMEAGVLRTIMNDGLADKEGTIQYMCAFHLGEHKVYASFRRLRNVLDDAERDELTRYAAAKSLAELGEADGLALIYDGLGSDHYMFRYLSNLGLEALTGRDLNDFDYDYGESAFVSGGMELKTARRPVEDAEKRAKRFETIAAYCRWLRDERPELYKHLEGA